MNERVNAVVSDLNSIAEDAGAAFGSLSAVQLNWKPSEKSWSVAQCFDHLITINTLYFPIFEKFAEGNTAAGFWEKYSPFSGFFGGYLIKVLSPEYEKKMKTSKKAYPSASDLGGDIVARFGDHNRELAESIGSLPDAHDLNTVITSPLASFVTYSLDDCLTILVVHERRHLLQAERVARAEGFPA